MRRSEYDRKYRNCISRIIISSVLIFISIFIINFVISKIITYPYLSNIKVKDNEPSINVIADDGYVDDAVFITDDKGIRYRKEDKSFARDEWIEKNGELFYFDNTSYGKEGWLNLLGQSYYFEKGKLKTIQRDKKYDDYVEDELKNSINSSQYLIYLDLNKKDDNDNFAIKYKKYEDEIEDYLGTSEDIQYSGEGLINIHINNVYYVTLRKNVNFGTLNRMRPNAEKKEYLDARVYGYIVLSNDIVYYYNGNVIMKAKNWKTESVKFLNDESDIVNEIDAVPISPMGRFDPIIQSTPRRLVSEITPVGVVTSSNATSGVPKNITDIEEPIDEVVVGKAPGSNSSSSNNSEDVERRSAMPPIPIPNIFALPR